MFGGQQEQGPVGLACDPTFAQVSDGVLDRTGLVQTLPLGEPDVEVDTHVLQRLLDVAAHRLDRECAERSSRVRVDGRLVGAGHGVVVEDEVPVVVMARAAAGEVRRRRVGGADGAVEHLGTVLGGDLGGDLRDVVALVVVLAEFLAGVDQRDGLAEQAHLLPGVVDVVLALDVVTDGSEQFGDRVTRRGPTTSTCVQRTGGVGRDELDVHLLGVGCLRPPPLAVRVQDTADDVVPVAVAEPEVQEPRTCDLDRRHCVGELERVDDCLRDLARVLLGRLRQAQRHGCGPVAVVGVARPLEVGVGGGQVRGVQRSAQALGEVGEDGVEIGGRGHARSKWEVTADEPAA